MSARRGCMHAVIIVCTIWSEDLFYFGTECKCMHAVHFTYHKVLFVWLYILHVDNGSLRLQVDSAHNIIPPLN
jgi:hypothetical protein